MRPLAMLSQPFTFICMLLVLGGSVLQAQVKIYGMTTQGGGPDAGTLYSVNLDGTNYQQLYTFQGQGLNDQDKPLACADRRPPPRGFPQRSRCRSAGR